MFSPFPYISKFKAFLYVLIFIVWSKLVFKPSVDTNKHFYEVFLAALVFGIVWFFLSRYNALKWIFAFSLGFMLLRNTVDFGKYFFYCFGGFVLFGYLIQRNGT